MMGPADIRLSDKVTIGVGHPCLIVAEIGQNHQGDINIAEQMISTAKDCGADVVKFQMSCLEEKFTKSALAREYIGPNSWGKTYGDHKKHLEFTREEFNRLNNYAMTKDVLFTASAMDVVSLDFLESMNPPFIKIGSGDNTNSILLDNAVSLKRPLVISTGMLNMDGVKRLYKLCKKKRNIALLHCVSAYPTPLQAINLNVLDTYKEEFPDVLIGYSGHEEGVAVSIAAVAKGAKVLERHITLDKRWKGTDHTCSLDPGQFSDLIRCVRQVEASMGTRLKQFQDCEMPCFEKLGKSIVTGEKVQAGTKLAEHHVKIKVSQPKGLDPSMLHKILGKITKNDLEDDAPITIDDVQF